MWCLIDKSTNPIHRALPSWLITTLRPHWVWIFLEDNHSILMSTPLVIQKHAHNRLLIVALLTVNFSPGTNHNLRYPSSNSPAMLCAHFHQPTVMLRWFPFTPSEPSDYTGTKQWINLGLTLRVCIINSAQAPPSETLIWSNWLLCLWHDPIILFWISYFQLPQWLRLGTGVSILKKLSRWFFCAARLRTNGNEK